jgi:3-hydroxyacyl-[acyl-carrier-protein] dehydratase
MTPTTSTPTTTYQLPYPKELLPHRDPMLLIDSVKEYKPGISVIAETHVKPGNRFFEGHFPGEPIMPGVILVEMMFQACGIFGRLEALSKAQQQAPTNGPAAGPGRQPGGPPPSGRAIKIEQVAFSRVVLPDSHLQIRVRHKYQIMHYMIFDAVVEIMGGGGVAAKGTVTVLIR